MNPRASEAKETIQQKRTKTSDDFKKMSKTMNWLMILSLPASASQAKSLPFVGNLNRMNETSRKASSAIASCTTLTFFGDIKLAGRIRESKNNHNSNSILNNDVQFRRRSGFFGVHRPIFGVARTDPLPLIPSATDSAGRTLQLTEEAAIETPEHARRRAGLQQHRPLELEWPANVQSGIAQSLFFARAFDTAIA